MSPVNVRLLHWNASLETRALYRLSLALRTIMYSHSSKETMVYYTQNSDDFKYRSEFKLLCALEDVCKIDYFICAAVK